MNADLRFLLRRKSLCFLAVVSLLSPGSILAAADQAPSANSGRSARAEFHAKMAESHKALADCLKSNKPEDQCLREHGSTCPMAVNGGRCPMFDGERGWMMHRGGMRGWYPDKVKESATPAPKK